MRGLLCGLLAFVLVAAPPQSVPGNTRRIEYPQEKFSIAIPGTWNEIEAPVLSFMSAAIPQAAANLPAIKIRHGFRASATSGSGFPWVAVLITENPVDEMVFERIEYVRHTVDDMIRKWESSGGTLERAQMDHVSYDKDRHLLWGISQSTFSGVGELRTLSGAHLTTTGSIQVHCYSKADDFVRNQPVCKEIIESVVIDPKIAIPARPANSPPLDESKATDYEALLRRVQAGDLSIDFRAFRLACMKSSQCQPRGTKADLAAMNQASRDGQFTKVVEIAERLIANGFVNLEVHATSVAAYRALHDTAKAKFHLDVTAGLMRSIIFSGDGKTRETAFEVISDREEYSLLAAKNLRYLNAEVSSTSIEDAGHHYDRWEVFDPKAGKTVIIFFNTDAFTDKSRVAAN